MGELGETLASLFQGFDVFGAEVWHRRLDINRDQVKQHLMNQPLILMSKHAWHMLLLASGLVTSSDLTLTKSALTASDILLVCRDTYRLQKTCVPFFVSI